MLRYVLEPGAKQRLEPAAGQHDAGAEGPQLNAEETLEVLRATTIGSGQEVQTPFGCRRLVYTDYTASGRGSTIVEDFMREKVLPCYGNTHTLTTATARQTTYLRAEAREVVRHHLNASHEDAVIFAGNGSTGAAHLFAQALQRASFDIGGTEAASSGSGSNGELRDMYYREDRWGSGECTLCGVRVKSAPLYQAHKHSETHRAKLRRAEGAKEGGEGRRSRRVVVITDPTLHHSSSLPFREFLPKYPLVTPAALESFSGSSSRSATADAAEATRTEVEISNLAMDESTGLFMEDELRRRLEHLSAWRGGDAGQHELIVICILAAASNVTGICADVPRVTASVRSACPSAVVCWDFAAAAGHRRCDLNPPGNEAAVVDAAFFSPHKLWGGPGSVGVLAVKKRLLCNAVPAVVGGGVVFYVTDKGHTYIQNSEEREEAGTPNILGCIRAGLAYHLLDQIPAAAVESRESAMLRRMLQAWSGHPRIEILGPAHKSAEVKQVSTGGATGVVSFMVRYGNASPGLYLHYNFVAALLNDLFGVQARGGCACAGPYAQWLLGISQELSAEFEECLQRTAQEVLRPGFVRVGAHWASTDEELDVLIAAVLWVAEHGWKLLAAYTFDRETGEWLHRLDTPERRRIWLSSVRPGNHLQTASVGPISQLESTLNIGDHASRAPKGAAELTLAADAALKEAYSSAQVALSSSKCPVLDPSFAHLLWFALPSDVAYTLRSSQPSKPQIVTEGSVFMAAAAGAAAVRPEHSSMDARPAQANPQDDTAGSDEAAASEQNADMNFELMQPEAEEEERSKAEVAPAYPKNVLRPKMTKQMRGLVGKAIGDFSMVREGDRLLVGLSGGKDSLTILHVLLALQKSAPIKFHIAAATVDPQTPEYNPAPLVPYLAAMGVEYHMLSKPIIELAKTCLDPKRPSICAFCSRMKRGMLYSCMRENNYNVLVLGQHLDDFAESFFMSGIHNGLLRTMKAHYWVQQEDVRVCRPLLYVRESMTAAFAKENKLPVISDNCPACFSAPKERHKTKLLLASLEFDYPQLFPTLLRTMKPLYSVDSADKADWIASGDAEDEGGAMALPPSQRKQQQQHEDAGPTEAIQTAGTKTKQKRAQARQRPVKDTAAEDDFGAEYALTACGAAEGVAADTTVATRALNGTVASSEGAHVFTSGVLVGLAVGTCAGLLAGAVAARSFMRSSR